MSISLHHAPDFHAILHLLYAQPQTLPSLGRPNTSHLLIPLPPFRLIPMIDPTALATVVLLTSASALLLAAMLYPSKMLRWFQRKRYQYEVTFSLYMLTPTEKFIFNSVLFLLLSMLIIAASLYLPEHLSIIANRILYYVSGHQHSLDTHKMGHSAMAVSEMSQHAPMGGNINANGRAFMEP